MSTEFPTNLDTFTNPSSTDSLGSPSHSDQHTTLNTAVTALEEKVGIDGSAVTSSHDYKIDTLETDVSEINELAYRSFATTTYTLVASDAGKIVRSTGASAATITVPPQSSETFTSGQQIVIIQDGAGQITVAAGSGVTINSKDGNRKLSARYSAATLIRLPGDDYWYLIGDLTS
jgi:hypothetical protein